MGKQAEIDYLRKLGPATAEHALNKPFGDPECPYYFMSLAAVMQLLPLPPARVLDLGCGPGWTSCILARQGYDVVGQDIAPDMIELAERNRDRWEAESLTFTTGDYEDLDFEEEFDAAVFYDSLHHAVDEAAALRCVWRALRPGGICIASEPGAGHATRQHSVEAMEQYGITEKDMPPRHVIALARRIGFTSWRVVPHVKPYANLLYGTRPGQPLYRLSRWPAFFRALALSFYQLFRLRSYGIVVLTK